MAMFEFQLGAKPDIEKIQEQLAAMLSPAEAIPPTMAQHTPDMFPGEAPIPGLQDITDPGQTVEQQRVQQTTDLIGTLLGNSSTLPQGNALIGKIMGHALDQDVQGLKPSDIAALRNQAKPVREDWRNLQTNFSGMHSSYKATPGKGRAAADLAMVIQFAKMLDPTSVVRSEEGETIQKTGGFFGVLRGLEKQIKGEGSLDQAARDGLMAEATRQFTSRTGALQPDIEFYTNIANTNRLPVSQLLAPDMVDQGDMMQRAKKILEGVLGPVSPSQPQRDKPVKQVRLPAKHLRMKGHVYETGVGPRRWTGTGWELP